MSRFSSTEKSVLGQIRSEYSWVAQRTLATMVVTKNLSGRLNRKATNSGLNSRSSQSIYGAIRRLDLDKAEAARFHSYMSSPVLG